MAHMFVKTKEGLAVAAMQSPVIELTGREDEPFRGRAVDGQSHMETKNKSSVIIVRNEDPNRDTWELIAPAKHQDVWVNGDPLLLGIHRLNDKDEIRVGNMRLFFIDEDPVAIQPFPGSDREVLCLRCQVPLKEGKPSVRCPRCGSWHHQNEKKKPCWTYTAHCANPACQQPTSLDTDFSWTPKDL